MASDGPPFPYGYQAASESTGSVASPLLAGFSFALVGLVLPSPEHFRWPNLTLGCLFVAGVGFIAAVQCGFWARQYAVRPEDIKAWRPEYPAKRIDAVQRLHNRGFYIWNHRLNWLYRWSILFLLMGMAFALVPPGDASARRWVIVAIALAAVVAELGWIVAISFLADGPSAAYNDAADVPPEDARARQLKGWPPLRRVARAYVPLPRVHVEPDEASNGGS